MMDTLTVILSGLIVLMGAYITRLHAKLSLCETVIAKLAFVIMHEQEQNDDDE